MASHENRAAPPASRDRVFIFVLAVAASLAAIAITGFRTVGFGDARVYMDAAQSLLTLHSYPAWTDLLIFRPPGYPVFLALATFGHPHAVALAKCWNALFHGLSSLLIASLVWRCFHSRVAAVLSGVAAALHPPFLYLTTQVQTEPLFIFLLLLFAFLLLAGADRPSSLLAAAAGIALGLAALTRPAALSLIPLLFAPLFDRRYPARVRRALCGSAFLGIVLCVGPWTLRNAIRFHALLPVNDGGGLVFYQGNSPWNLRYYQVKNRAELDFWIRDYGIAMKRDWPRQIPGAWSKNPARRSAAFVHAAVVWIQANPHKEMDLLLEKLGDWLRPWANPLAWPRAVVFSSGIYYSFLFVLTAVGLSLTRRRGVAFFALAVLIISTFVHVACLVSWRYRMPFWDPVLEVFGIGGVSAYLFSAKERRAETA